MLDEKNFFWKNWRLGTELQVTGTFIYNSLYNVDDIAYFNQEEECFEFLYNISIGIERLQKILIILAEHDESMVQSEFEKSLMTHDHIELHKRIGAKQKLNFGKVHTKFLSLLANFYKSVRYERFNMASIYKPSQDKEKLTDFIVSQLNVQLVGYQEKSLENTLKVKAFLGRIIKKIVVSLYERIRQETSRLQIFTHEIRYGSKAFKIFIEQEFDFKNERLMQREVLLHLLKHFPNDELKKFIDAIEPLALEQCHTNDYIQGLLNIRKATSVKDEVKYLYEEDKPSKERLEDILVIGSDINFDYFNEEGEDKIF